MVLYSVKSTYFTTKIFSVYVRWQILLFGTYVNVASCIAQAKNNAMHQSNLHLSSKYISLTWVKVQFRGPKLYKKEGHYFKKNLTCWESLGFSSLNLHTFHFINIVFWWQIFFHKHGKSTPNDRQDHHVLVVVVVIMTSQCRCTRTLSQSHVAKHDNHVPVMLLIGSGTGCHVDAMAAVWQNHISKNIKFTLKLRPSIHNCIASLFMKV